MHPLRILVHLELYIDTIFLSSRAEHGAAANSLLFTTVGCGLFTRSQKND